ncbi:glycosyltransferase [Mycobacterium phage Sparky]|uniref:Glycosyltransferase n=1 Tax=Mycobacterium phage Sparky TaxID=1527493 RepID=A0A076G7G5_9CAUD|nr:glycosyltransferase [Mycobacterium phage Sparky]AII28232.1 glycosyltransferase [Mycobacterium phage Sparky]
MPNVVVDGVEYQPVTAAVAGPNVGIAITTKDRHDTFRECLAKVRAHTPATFPIVIVDDGSKPPVLEATIRHDTSRGIPAAKNACLAALMDLGVEHLFLLDNDCYPLTDDWWRPFVESPEIHLSAQFLDVDGPRKLNDITVLYDDGQHQAWSGQRGYCLYYHRSAIDAVGGFDPIYSPGLYEHSDLANRLFARGLTTWRYASPKDSHKLIESLDQRKSVQRTPLPSRDALVHRNAGIHNERRAAAYADYVEYRDTRDVILTCLYTGNTDPQRGARMAADPKALDTLTRSAKPHPVIVLNDQLTATNHDNVTYISAPNTVNVYFQRWINAHRYLAEHPDVNKVLVCDGTDVEILKPADLFDVPAGKLMVGSEHQIVGCQWMRSNHPDDDTIRRFLDAHHHEQLLNAGVLLGHRADVMAFILDIIHTWHDIEMAAFHKTSKGNGIGDMAVFNHVAYTKHRDKLIYGPAVTTMFKADERNSFSRIRHK